MKGDQESNPATINAATGEALLGVTPPPPPARAGMAGAAGPRRQKMAAKDTADTPRRQGPQDRPAQRPKSKTSARRSLTTPTALSIREEERGFFFSGKFQTRFCETSTDLLS